jgi:hypothetical protein
MYSIVAAHRCILLVQQIISEKGLKREKKKDVRKKRSLQNIFLGKNEMEMYDRTKASILLF